MATIYIGHASISEKGTAQGEKGDQTGSEVCTRSWYNYKGGWDFIAIHPDSNVREKHATLVEEACANDNIGYGQDDRNSLHTQAVELKYALSKIKTLCNCDCSSLQHVCAIGSGGMAESTYGSNGMTTSGMKSKLKEAGYVIITDSTYAQNSSYCVRGAIYVKAGHHTVTGLTNGSNYKKTLEKAGVSGTSSTSSGSGSSSSGSTSSSTKDSYDESLAGTYTVTANSGLNVRKAAGSSSAKVVAIPKNTSVKCDGHYQTSGSTKWLYITFTYNSKSYSGYATSSYLKKSSSSSSSSSSGSSSSSKKPSYKVGTTYKTQVDRLNVRTGAGTNYSTVSYKNLSSNAKIHAYSNGSLQKGTAVTCKATKTVGSDIWMQIPSGWIAAYYKGDTYVS